MFSALLLTSTAKIRRLFLPSKCLICVKNLLIQVKSKNKTFESADLAMHFD
nr:MAG TPA: hypothetical protein [Caudoviricetes sp.]